MQLLLIFYLLRKWLIFERIDAIMIVGRKEYNVYEIIFYEDKNGRSDLYETLLTLTKASKNNKDARIQLNQIVYCIDLLKNSGTRIPSNITKHIEDNIWELRPGNNRILYFYYIDNVFVLLHMFRKQTQKTPRSEIEQAKKERDNYITRKGGTKL